MPILKRFFPCSREINDDPEVWELTDTFGDRAIRLWLEILSITDKTNNDFKLSGPWVAQIAKHTKLNLKTVVRAIAWMVERNWVTVLGERSAANAWVSSLLKLAEDWPETHRRLAGDLPETHRRLVEEWSENGRKLSLCVSNYAKYHKSRETKKHFDVSPPNLTEPNLVKKEEESPPGGGPSAPENVIQFPRPIKKQKLTDAEFLADLKKNLAYAHIDIDRELAKMDAWLLLRPNRQKTRRFIVSWLNRIEKPIGPTPSAPAKREVVL